ncbi:TPA: AAA family ATPase [Bacillus pacificus]|uniref:AAA family ATPase n=2 Tax=Bacillaceae TaxID=186817 RepID=UPI000627A083|nr:MULTISPECIES: AAA family ATPase [Bacillus cereus group]MDA1691122.1 AAA family ATPase [Bacillus cereus group sp. TH147LC]KMQ35797.1 Tn7 transposition protein C [Bacillus cereus]MDA2034091.1 AAA family ATPase [Bacillus cereus group sp. Bcc02]MDR4260170.1 AAA family ATPase [Bacillus pacificus]MDZ4427505.1 AAA family ATPase [Bacillus cereus]
MSQNPDMVQLENGTYALLASYKEQQLVEYQGNPLIEALPPILSYEEAFDQLSFFPEYHEKEKNLSEHHRYHALLRLTRFFQPIGQTLDLERRFSRFLRYGYVNRNPLQKQHIQALNELHQKLVKKEELGLSPDIRATASSFTLMGFSGVGKSTAIERVLSLYPQLIVHQYPINTIQIVWLKLNCPHDGSLKSLCQNFFEKIDTLIGTNYLHKYGKSHISVSSMVTRMGQIARLHCVGAVIIDEIQHLLSTKGDASEKMMNFFVTLINEIGIPVMMIGTMRARAILQKDFRQARRGSGQGDMIWQQMDNSEDWEVLLTSIWDYQWTKEYVELNQELIKLIYEESQGIIDIAIKIFILAQGRAIETSTEKISIELIKKVVKEDLKLVQPMLKALKSGVESEIAKYEDIIALDIKEYMLNKIPVIDMRARIQAQKEKIKKDSEANESSKLEKLILSLINLDVNEKHAEKIAKRVLNKLPNLTIAELMKEALKCINECETDKRKKNNKALNMNMLQLLINKGKKTKQSAYEALYDNGYIKKPLEESFYEEERLC